MDLKLNERRYWLWLGVPLLIALLVIFVVGGVYFLAPAQKHT